jgi:ABC-2 type transport system permease protein
MEWKNKLKIILAIMMKELTSYFSLPTAYVFISMFLFALNILGFYVGDFLAHDYAGLQDFFRWHPWVYFFFIPAVTMRLWADERCQGTLEFLVTLPVTAWQIVLGKFLASWVLVIIALACTTPVWVTVSYLGDPDHGVIILSYFTSIILAGAYLAMGSFMSALTNNQVTAFISTFIFITVFNFGGVSMITDFLQYWTHRGVGGVINRLSLLEHYSLAIQGVLPLASLVFFVSFSVFWLSLTTVVIERKERV